MPSIISLVAKLQRDYPAFTFHPASEFQWSPTTQTILYNPTSSDTPSLLHELSHAVLNHTTYARDITLLQLEREAWQYAISTLAPFYTVIIPKEEAERALDTYRDWLHQRSTCPSCSANGVQTKPRQYRCVVCHTGWRVNEARSCALRRYTLQKTKDTP